MQLGLGDTDAAFALLSRAVQAHDGGLYFSPLTPATIRCAGILDSSACSDGSGFPTA